MTIKLTGKDRARARDAIRACCRSDPEGNIERVAVVMHDVRLAERLTLLREVRREWDKASRSGRPHDAFHKALWLLEQEELA